MDSDGTSHLSQTRDGHLDFLAGGHDQIGKFIHDNHDIGQAFQLFIVLGFLVVADDIAHFGFLEQLIAALHLLHCPIHGFQGCIRIGDHAADQVRKLVVTCQFHPFGIDQHQTQVFGCGAQDQAHDDGVDANAFTAAGGTCHQKVRHLRQIGDDRLAGDIFAQAKEELVR